MTGLTNGTAYTFKVTRAPTRVGHRPAVRGHRARSRRRRRSSTSPRRPASTRGDTIARSSWASSSRPTTTARSPASASTRPRPTPARTSAACGRSTGTQLAQATFTNETASGWQTVTFSTPGRDHRRHHLRRVLLRAQRRTTRPPRTASAHAVDNGPLHARRERDQRQRRLRLQRHQRLPDQPLQRRQLLGRRDVRRCRCPAS